MFGTAILLPRWLPSLLASCGVWVSVKMGAPGVRDLVDIAKVGCTRHELAMLAHHIHADAASGFQLPDPAQAGSLAAYVKRAAFTYTGRDPSKDFWGNPYVLKTQGGAGTWELRSFGPDGTSGLCPTDLAPTAFTGDTSDSGIVVASNDAPPTGSPSVGDDICIVVKPLKF